MVLHRISGIPLSSHHHVEQNSEIDRRLACIDNGESAVRPAFNSAQPRGAYSLPIKRDESSRMSPVSGFVESDRKLQGRPHVKRDQSAPNHSSTHLPSSQIRGLIMDFLKHNLKPEEHAAQPVEDETLFDKLGGILHSQIQPTPPAAPVPHTTPKPEGLLGRVGDALHHASAAPPQPIPTPVKEDTSLFGKLSSALNSPVPTLAPQPVAPKPEGLLGKVGEALHHAPAPAPPPPAPKREGLLEKVGDVLHHTPTPPPPPPAPKPEGLLGKIGDALHHVSTPPPPPPAPKPESLLEKVGDALHHTSTPPTPPPAPKPEGLLGKVGDVLHHAHTPTPPPPAPVKEDLSLLGKISGAVGGEHKSAAAPAVPPKQEGLLGKIGGALGVEKHTPESPKPEGLFEKIGGALGVEKPAPEPPKQEGLLGKIGDVIGGKHAEPAKPTTLVGKIDQALGGGAASEKNEDYLDKSTFDGFPDLHGFLSRG